MHSDKMMLCVIDLHSEGEGRSRVAVGYILKIDGSRYVWLLGVA